MLPTSLTETELIIIVSDIFDVYINYLFGITRYKDNALEPIEKMLSSYKEGERHPSCAICGFILSKETTIEDLDNYVVITYGKCLKSWEVYGKLIGYKEYNE